jgi:hypothetical protein
MAVKQNAVDFATEVFIVAKVVDTSFYVDDCLTVANSTDEALDLHTQLHTILQGWFSLEEMEFH